MRLNTCRPSAVIVLRTFWPTLISVICLEKLRDLSLGPLTLFQQPMLRFYPAALVVPLYPVATCQAMRPLLRIWAMWRSRTVGSLRAV